MLTKSLIVLEKNVFLVFKRSVSNPDIFKTSSFSLRLSGKSSIPLECLIRNKIINKTTIKMMTKQIAQFSTIAWLYNKRTGFRLLGIRRKIKNKIDEI